MRTRAAVLLTTLAVSSGPAWAGRVNHFETTVNASTQEAYGSLVDTRRSTDTVQYIGCDLNLVLGTVTVACAARSVTSAPLSCSSTDPELVTLAQGLTDNGYVRFRCDGSTLVYLFVSKGSAWLP
jgi:hypothetical protein